MPIPKRIVKQVLERDGGACVLSSRLCLGQASCADHRVGRGMGSSKGLDVPANLVAACSICNGLKESDAVFRAECTSRGLHIKRSQATALDIQHCLETPIVAPDGTLWLLTADGKREPYKGNWTPF